MNDRAGDNERRLFDRAATLPESQWSAFLDEHCGDDPGLRTRLERLLEAHRSLLSQPTEVGTAVWSLDDDPESIGPFRIQGRLGEGGMGVVYDAVQSEPIQRRVALKVIKPGMDSKQVLARFESERQTLAMLEHPGIARVLDAGNTARGLPYFVMEFVDGEPIDAYCDQRRLDIDARLELFADLTDAIRHAHMKGIIHRDLKPSNILVTGEHGRHMPKVIDFGIAKALTQGKDAATRFTELGQMIGTPDFMSPEQARGEDVDTRTDVYSLGVVLYELLTGTTPLDTGSQQSSLAELQRRICEVEPPRPSSRWSGQQETVERAVRRGTDPSRLARRLSGELDAIVLKSLEKDPERRYSSIAAFADDVRRYRTSQPVLARPHSTAYQIRKLIGRNKLAAAFVAVVCALLVAFAATMGIQLQRVAKARDRAEGEAAKAVAINQFLHETLQAADPWGGGSREITVVDALDDAVKEIDGAFADQPLIEASVRVSVGSTYAALGRYDEAEALLQRAMALRKAHLNGDHADLVEVYGHLGLLYLLSGDYDEAENHAREALAIQQRLSGDRDPETARRMKEFAATLDFQGKFAEAEPLARQAVEIYRNALGDHDEDIAKALDTLGAVVWQQGDLEQAEPLVVEALATYRRARGNEGPLVQKMLTTLGLIRMSKGDLAAAESDINEALELQRRLFGDEHPDVAGSLENLANVYYRGDRLDESIELLNQVLEMRRRNLGETDLAVGRTFANIAALNLKLERWDAVEVACRQALDRMRVALNPQHPNLVRVLGHLKTALAAKGDTAGAEAATQEILRIQELQQGDGAGN